MGPGPNSVQIRKIAPEWAPEMKQNIGNTYQTEDNKNPRGRREAPPPLGGAEGAPCCLLFGKDFPCFASFPEPILGRFPELGPGPIQDLKSYSFFQLPSSRAIWTVRHPKDTKSGHPPGVVGSPGTLRTPNVVPHLGFPYVFRVNFDMKRSEMHENQQKSPLGDFFIAATQARFGKTFKKHGSP